MKIEKVLACGAILIFTAAVSLPAQTAHDDSAAKSVHKDKVQKPGKELARGGEDIGKGAAKGSADLGKGIASGAGNLATGNVGGAGASLGKGAAGFGKNVGSGAAKGTAKIGKGVGGELKKIHRKHHQ